MKKLMMYVAFLFVSGILIGCSDNNENANNNQNNGENTEANNEQNNDNNVENNDNSQNENDSSKDNNLGNDNEDNDDNNDTDGSFEPEEEDQEGLGIGDTGTFDTIVGSYEMTLDSAELLGSEIDEITSQRDDFILLDITIKNIGDETQSIEDLVEDMQVAIEEDVTGDDDIAEVFDSYEKFEGELEPGEEESGQFITEVSDADMYYFKYNSGDAGAGASNQVIWEFEPEEE